MRLGSRFCPTKNRRKAALSVCPRHRQGHSPPFTTFSTRLAWMTAERPTRCYRQTEGRTLPRFLYQERRLPLFHGRCRKGRDFCICSISRYLPVRRAVRHSMGVVLSVLPPRLPDFSDMPWFLLPIQRHSILLPLLLSLRT